MTAAISRVLTCHGCGDDVEVYEAPRQWIDPALYRCGNCLHVVTEPAQLSIVGDDVPPRTETPPFDPDMFVIPF